MWFSSLFDYYTMYPGRKGPMDEWQLVRKQILKKVRQEKRKINNIPISQLEDVYQQAFYGKHANTNLIKQAADDVVDNMQVTSFAQGIDMMAQEPLTESVYKQHIDRVISKYNTHNANLKTIREDLQYIETKIIPNFLKINSTANAISVVDNLRNEINRFVNALQANHGETANLIRFTALERNDLINICNTARAITNALPNNEFNMPQIGRFFENAYEAINNTLNGMVIQGQVNGIQQSIKILSASNTATDLTKMAEVVRTTSRVTFDDDFIDSYTSSKNGRTRVQYKATTAKGSVSFQINSRSYDFNTDKQQKADAVLTIEDNKSQTQDIGVSLKNWASMTGKYNNISVSLANSIFQATGSMEPLKNFTYMLQDNRSALADHFTQTRGEDAVDVAFDMAKVCGAVTALMGLSQKSSSRAQILVINDREQKRIRVIDMPMLILDYANNTQTYQNYKLELSNEDQLSKLNDKIGRLSFHTKQTREKRKKEGLYDNDWLKLAIGLLNSVKLKYSLA